ncbi:MAG: hypothetical protein MZV49_06155 [Rhodopseudomonas palustris]|nr:hypothetical protein [Rhodopseudomonas palustris]
MIADHCYGCTAGPGQQLRRRARRRERHEPQARSSSARSCCWSSRSSLSISTSWLTPRRAQVQPGPLRGVAFGLAAGWSPERSSSFTCW